MSRRSMAVDWERTRLWEVTPDLLAVSDLNGRFLHCNPAWKAVLDRSPEELEGSRFEDLVHPDDLQRSRARLERTVATGEPVLRFEDRYRHRDGSYRWLSWVAVPADDAIYCSARDITEDRRREAKLAERNRVWTGSRDLYVTLGTDGVYRELNPAWQTELGHDPVALVGSAFYALLHPDELDAAGAEFARTVAGERVIDHEIRIRTADGSYRWYSFDGFMEGGLILAMGRNVDERRQGEADLEAAAEALRQSQKLEMIGQLTGGVAHDFNNLLMAVQANLESLGAALPAQRTEWLHLLDNALSGVARGAALTQRMLAFARRQELAPAAVDVARLIEGMRDLLVRTLGPGVRIRTRIGHSVPMALVDAHQLEMALLNLAVNARDAMEGAGELVFAVTVHATLPGGTLAAGRYVRVRVSDTGSGMDSATLAKATEPFFTTKAVGDGTGLGLSMVHGLTEQSGGSFRLIERREGGITAEIMLPVAEGAPGGADGPASPTSVPPEVAAEPAPNTTPARVLLVDDDALVLHGIARMLERFGHDVWKAPSGKVALQILADEPAFDLLITDHAMPGMSGLELARTVRQRGFTKGIVLSSGYAAAAEIADGELISAELRKPFAGKQLLAVVNRVLESTRRGGSTDRFDESPSGRGPTR